MDYRSALRTVRLALGIGAQDVADHIDMDKGQYSRSEKGRAGLSVEQFFKACFYMGVSPEKLFNLALVTQDGEKIDVQSIKPGFQERLESIVMPDNSMQRTDGSGIPQGACIYYEKAEPANNDLVVVKVGNGVYVRRFIDDMGQYKLKPHNERDYDTRDLVSDAIVGVVRDVSFAPILNRI